MTILQLCNKAPYPANDGSSIAICTLTEGLIENGVELFLLSINTKKHFKADDSIPIDFKQKTNYKSVYKNTDTTIFGAITNLLFSTQSYFVSRFYFNEFEQILIKTLKQKTFDIIQLEGVFMASYIDVIKKYSNAKISLRSHNIEHQIWERQLKLETNFVKKVYLSIQNKRLKKFEINALKKVAAVVTITDDDKQAIMAMYPNIIAHTCLTGLNLNSYQYITKPQQKNTVFHFASMDWMPNIDAVDWLINKVWDKVLNKVPNAKLVIAGRGMPQKFKKSNSPSITVIESVDNSAQFYSTYDIMVVPLWSGSGLRIKLVEGLAYGKPIITTSIGAEGINYTNNKNMLIADNETDFANAIVDILKDENLKISLQQNARKLAETDFEYKSIAAKLIAFYKNL